ncbi:hypothetical protein KXV85_005891, partial [Aspergillus fumigatus]
MAGADPALSSRELSSQLPLSFPGGVAHRSIAFSQGAVTMTSNEIFILEDDLTMRAMLKASLERAGYQVVFFADGDALLAHARQASPACVLLDLCLPGKSGIEVLTTLNSQGCSAPVLMISGQGNIPTAVQALRLGAADFIEKP